MLFGPLGSGKRTTLEQLAGEAPSSQPHSTSVDTFSFVPLRLHMSKGPDLVFHVFAMHSECESPHLNERLDGTDAFILVADARLSEIDNNLAAAEKLKAILNDKEMSLCPVVLQLNKRELPDAIPGEEFEALVPWIKARIETTAISGSGVRDTFKAVIQSLDL